MGLLCAITTVLMVVIQRFSQPEMAAAQETTFVRFNILLLFLGSIAIACIQRFGVLNPQAIIHLGLVYEVVVAFTLASFEFSVPWHTGEVVRGTSWVAFWLAMYGLLVPSSTKLMIVGAFASAAMQPLVYFLTRWVYGYNALPPGRLLPWLFPTFLAAVWTVWMARRLYRLEMEVRRAQELGSYHLEAMLGKGGMGEVWRAKHRMLARDAAIKLIRPEMLLAESGRDANHIRRRFEHEARATASLRSPHTVALYDFGVAEDGSFFYAMELLDGIDLETLVKRFGPQPPARVIDLLRQACNSLAEAHQSGLVHRDIKPTNLFVCRLGLNYDFLKVLDFGLVKTLVSREESRMTMDRGTTGTPAFMAPEIALSNPVDGHVDIYGLGCVGYWLLTGSLVFDEPSATAMIVAHVQKQPKAPSLGAPDAVPAGLDKIILQCLEKNPSNRPESAITLARTLEELASSYPWTQADAEQWWAANLKTTSVDDVTGPVPAKVIDTQMPTL
jgi:eukaryotic-like serine/threonine-protein kinase